MLMAQLEIIARLRFNSDYIEDNFRSISLSLVKFYFSEFSAFPLRAAAMERYRSPTRREGVGAGANERQRTNESRAKLEKGAYELE